MKEIKPEVWEILMEDEKLALGLQFTMDKSSWEAGEIMNKSHYKYLEIKYRAEKFVRMFTEHFNLYDKVIEDYVQGEDYIKDFFTLCIQKRNKPGQAISALNEKHGKDYDRAKVNLKISNSMELWDDPNKPHEYVIFNLIKDFDRWNNFRILPTDLQEPSAFKRRIKNSYKRQVKLTSTLPEISIWKIKEQCSQSGKGAHLILPLVNIHKKQTEIIKVKNNKRTLELLTSIGLYVFPKLEDALKYINPLFEYVVKSDRDCKDGLDFWPTYREVIKKAKNYESLQNINPSRKYLDLALSKYKFL